MVFRLYKHVPDYKSVYEKIKLSQLDELNILGEEEGKKLEELNKFFEPITTRVSQATDKDSREIQIKLRDILSGDGVKNLSEAEEIIIYGPIVEGFDEARDLYIPNHEIRNFLNNTFGQDNLLKTHIYRVVKNNKYLINNLRNSTWGARRDELLARGLLQNEPDSKTFLSADTKEGYIQSEMFLEGVSNEEELTHIYKLRAFTGNSYVLRIYNFIYEEIENLDYLPTEILNTKEEKMRAYILGTIAHEVGHNIYRNMIEKTDDRLNNYEKIVEEEIEPKLRPKFVSEYAARYQNIYNNSMETTYEEDFAESIRIYATNSNYLKNNFPRRFNFIKQYLPSINTDTVF